MNRHLLSFSFLLVLALITSSLQAQYWKLTGNSDATNTSKLGTLNAFPLRFYTKSLERMQIDSQGRVTIGANSSSSSALFEVASTNRGVLISRMTQAQRNAIWMPAQGLLVYQTDGTRGFYYYDGGWKPIAPPAANTSGFANTMLSNLVPTAVNQDLVADGDNTRSLGSSSKGWQNLYLTSSVYLGGQRFLSGPGDNTFTGRGAGVNTTGTQNSAYGYQALFSNTSGEANAAHGFQSLYSNTTGGANTAQGYQALYTNTLGNGNTAQGFRSLFSNTTGNDNTVQGNRALYYNTTGGGNVALGIQALYNNTSADNNTAVGNQSLYSNTTGNSNAAQGFQSLYSNTTGSNNSAQGYQSLYNNTSGGGNAAHGYQALYSNTTGPSNTAVGYQSLYSNTTGSDNTAVGLSSLTKNTNGSLNTAQGSGALFSNTSGNANTAQGSQSLYSNTTGAYNTAQGFQSLFYNTTGNSNTAHGNSALFSNTTGAFNTAMGDQSLFSNTTGSGNIAHGVQALNSNTTGRDNTGVGTQALYSNTTANGNTALGTNALFYNTTGFGNTGVGVNAGLSCSTCTNATFLGANTSIAVDGLDNQTAVGSGATVTAPNTVVLGNPSVVGVFSSGAFVTTSDGRFKQDIKTDVPGLEFINKLRPVTYHYKIHELNSHIKQESKALPKAGGMETMKGMKGMDGMKGIEPPKADERVAAAAKAKEEESIRAKEAIKYTGFVAQEVEEAAKKVNYDFSGVHKPTGSKDVYGLSYAEFVVPLVKAVQELSKKADKVDELEKKVAVLEELVNKLTNGQSISNPTNSTSLSLSSAYLEQSTPNPNNGSAIIRYYVPSGAGSARLVFTDIKGSILKSVTLGKGKGQITISNNSLAAGAYTYTLYLNNAQVDSKQMVVGR